MLRFARMPRNPEREPLKLAYRQESNGAEEILKKERLARIHRHSASTGLSILAFSRALRCGAALDSRP